MFVTYSPEDGDEQKWSFDPDRVRRSEAAICVKVFGGNASWPEFVNAVRTGNPDARAVLLWHLLRRQHIALKYADVPDFAMGELEVEFSAAELVEMRAEVTAANSLTEERRTAMVAGLDREIAEAMQREGIADEAAIQGKARSN